MEAPLFDGVMDPTFDRWVAFNGLRAGRRLLLVLLLPLLLAVRAPPRHLHVG